MGRGGRIFDDSHWLRLYASLKTLVEASRSLGGNGPATLLRVVLPNLRTALLSATVLTVALVLGEFTMASLDQYQTFPVWVVAFDQNNSHVSVAVSLLALIGTWVLLIVISSLGRKRFRRTRRRVPVAPAGLGGIAGAVAPGPGGQP